MLFLLSSLGQIWKIILLLFTFTQFRRLQELAASVEIDSLAAVRQDELLVSECSAFDVRFAFDIQIAGEMLRLTVNNFPLPRKHLPSLNPELPLGLALGLPTTKAP